MDIEFSFISIITSSCEYFKAFSIRFEIAIPIKISSAFISLSTPKTLISLFLYFIFKSLIEFCTIFLIEI
ncbi:hypothetical protein [Aliarcobacter cryaerophilus]|uniref:hypothetical protein n=1 Tax=Aliarcobacter cryaerophilus TaxID=28198 RepID=UPI001F46E250|nr:hypothetical protein [Aliarcobacter cryaerophilus]